MKANASVVWIWTAVQDSPKMGKSDNNKVARTDITTLEKNFFHVGGLRNNPFVRNRPHATAHHRVLAEPSARRSDLLQHRFLRQSGRASVRWLRRLPEHRRAMLRYAPASATRDGSLISLRINVAKQTSVKALCSRCSHARPRTRDNVPSALACCQGLVPFLVRILQTSH